MIWWLVEGTQQSIYLWKTRLCIDHNDSCVAGLEEWIDASNKPNILLRFAASDQIDQREVEDVQDQSDNPVVSVQIVKKDHWSLWMCLNRKPGTKRQSENAETKFIMIGSYQDPYLGFVYFEKTTGLTTVGHIWDVHKRANNIAFVQYQLNLSLKWIVFSWYILLKRQRQR